jgi:hypothetical protein
MYRQLVKPVDRAFTPVGIEIRHALVLELLGPAEERQEPNCTVDE